MSVVPSSLSNEYPEWEYILLSLMGVPITEANLQFIGSWSTREGANNYNNPLNISSSPLGGQSGELNSTYHIQEYPDIATGIENTAAFITRSPYYQTIVAALKTGNPWNANLSQALQTWSGSGGYTSFPNYYQSGGASPTQGNQSSGNPLTNFLTGTGNAILNVGGNIGKTAQQMNPVTQFQNMITNINAGIFEGFILLGSVILIAVGGIWIVLSSRTVQKVTDTTVKVVKAGSAKAAEGAAVAE